MIHVDAKGRTMSHLMAEAMAMQSTVVEAFRLGFPAIRVEVDNLNVINAVLGDWKGP